MADTAADAPAAYGPPVLLLPVPTLPASDESGLPRLTFAFARVGGKTVAEGYTDRQRLVQACGPAQPWVAVAVSESITLLARAGATVLVVDRGAAGGAIGVDLTAAASVVGGAAR